MLNTKDLKYQMVERRTEKLTERFVGPYKVQKIQRYVGQVEGQRKEQLAPVIIKGKEEWEVERILNK